MSDFVPRAGYLWIKGGIYLNSDKISGISHLAKCSVAKISLLKDLQLKYLLSMVWRYCAGLNPLESVNQSGGYLAKALKAKDLLAKY